MRNVSRSTGAALAIALVMALGITPASAGSGDSHPGTSTVRSADSDVLRSDGLGSYQHGGDVTSDITDSRRGTDIFRLITNASRRLRVTLDGTTRTCEKPGLSYLTVTSNSSPNWYAAGPGTVIAGDATIACTIDGVNNVIAFGSGTQDCVQISHLAATTWSFEAPSVCPAYLYKGSKLKLVGAVEGGAPFQVTTEVNS